MNNVVQWWSHLITLFKGAFWAWWRLLPLLLAVYVLGRLGYEVFLIGAAAISASHPWLAMVLLSLSFMSLLSATIICLQRLGQELGIRRRVPELAADDDRDSSIARLLAITLLPFLGIYAAFGKIQTTAGQLTAYEVILRGILSPGMLTKLDPAPGSRDLWVMGGVIVGAYIIRRVADVAHEKTNFRPLGLVAAFIESFFLVLLVFVGTNLFARAKLFLADVNLAHWFRTLRDGLQRGLAEIAGFLPGFVDQAWLFVINTVWPLFVGALAEPLLWLAVAALVYGTHVLSFAEMWRKGEPLSVHLDESRVVRSRRAAARGTEAGNARSRAAVLEFQELLFGDLNDKYLPTLQSLRLVLRAGLLFLAAYLVAYGAIATVGQGVWMLVTWVMPLREQAFWVTWRQVIELAVDPVVETLRLALLATAFARALQLFQAHADPSTLADANDQPPSEFTFPELHLDDPDAEADQQARPGVVTVNPGQS